MEMGFAVPTAGSWASPANVTEVARLADRLGYRSVWTFQRLLYPADDGGRPWAPPYRSVLDPLVVLGQLAGTTTRARLGVAVVDAPFYSPALLAKQLTTVDVLSGGRLVAGLGIGWAGLEYAASGVSRERRGARLEEHLRVMTALWTGEPVRHDGEFYTVPGGMQRPVPVQRPRPRVLLGGSVDRALRRAGRLADGWVSGSGADLPAIGRSVEIVRRAAEEAGRDPAAVEVVCRGAVRLRDRATGEHPLAGPVEAIREAVGRLAEAGVTEFFVDLNFDPEVGSPDADPAASMDRARELLEAFAPGTDPTGWSRP